VNKKITINLSLLAVSAILLSACVPAFVSGGTELFSAQAAVKDDHTHAGGVSDDHSHQESAALETRLDLEVEDDLLLAAFINAENTQVTLTDEYILVDSAGVPNHHTADFPTSYNPNSIGVQDYHFQIPLEPAYSQETTELPGGPIGVMVNGVVFYSPYNANGGDAVPLEIFDDCNGHPDQSDRYHYHQSPVCILTGEDGQLVGFAFDGFPVYSSTDLNGSLPSDLDACNGHTHATEEYPDGVYHYHLTGSFPYIMGCYHGQVEVSNFDLGGQMLGGQAAPAPGSQGSPPRPGQRP
jgi:hypothetical protein